MDVAQPIPTENRAIYDRTKTYAFVIILTFKNISRKKYQIQEHSRVLRFCLNPVSEIRHHMVDMYMTLTH